MAKDLFVFGMYGLLTKDYLADILSEKYRPGVKPWGDEIVEDDLPTSEIVRMVGETHKGIPKSDMDSEAEKISPVEYSMAFMDALRDDFELLLATIDYGNLARRIAGKLRVRHYIANEAEYDDDGVHTGKIAEPIIDGCRKAMITKENFKTADGYKRIIAVGVNAADRHLFALSDVVSIAYNTVDSVLIEMAKHNIDGGNLRDVLDVIKKL